MNITMAVSFSVCPSLLAQLPAEPPVLIASAGATAPMAPPSVGVARPSRIVPSTIKISTREGTIDTMRHERQAQPHGARFLGKAGTGAAGDGRRKIVPQNSADQDEARNDGAGIHIAHRAAHGSASTISTKEGGMSWVMVPEAAITPVAALRS